MTIARQFAEILHGLGIRRAYGLPGEDHMGLLSEFSTAGIEYCTAYNESSAVIMAATDSHLSGLPGVVLLSMAPGVSNGFNGVLHAYVEELPLLVISGQHAAAQLPFVIRQGFDIMSLMAPVTKWRAKVTTDMDIAGVIAKAVDTAMISRPGPVYLEVPDGVANATVTPRPERTATVLETLAGRWNGGPGARQPSPASPDLVDLLSTRLAEAERPALVVGGRRRRVSPDVVRAFSEAWRIPVFTAPRQKGTLGPRDGYYAGTFLNGRLEKTILSRSDFVLMIDPEPFDIYHKPWCFDAEAFGVIEETFAAWSNVLAGQAVAEPDAVLTALTEDAARSKSLWETADVTAYREHVRSTLLGVNGDGMSVAQAIDAALSSHPKDGWLVGDAGFSKPLALLLSEPELPDRFLGSNALSTMGYSIPAATAAARAGAQSVLTFIGDGSLLMRATELMVGADTDSSMVFVGLMDRALTQIKVKQEQRDLQTVGVELPRVSCAALAAALNIAGSDVDNTADLAAAVAEGMKRKGPTLIGAYVDPNPSAILFDLVRG